MNKLYLLLCFISFHSQATDEWSVNAGIGLGSLYSKNICNTNEFQCERIAETYEVFSELVMPRYSIRANYFNFEKLSVDRRTASDDKQLDIRSLSIVPYYTFDLTKSTNLKFGAGLSIWHDHKYGSYFGESVVQSIVVDKTLDSLGFGVSLKIDFYPNFYKSSTDILVFGIQLYRRFADNPMAINSSRQAEGLPVRYIEDKVITLSFGDNSSDVTDEQLFDDFEDGNYFVIYGYRTHSENIITSIDRARKVERILMSRYPNSKIDVINMSDHHPLSDSYLDEGVAQERRVRLKIFKQVSD